MDEGKEDREQNQDPTQDPRVRSFLQRFPGKVIVQKE
jgi:hypothetical protein